MAFGGDTKQFVILKRLTELLEGVTPANGYDFDLTGKVFRGKLVFGAQESTPFVSIVEFPRPDTAPIEGGTEKLRRLEEWELQVQGWTKTTQANPTDELYGLKGAIEHRLALIMAVNELGNPTSIENYRLGRVIDRARIGPGVVRAATPQVAGTEALYLPLIIHYTYNVADPWAV
jgi:hypothetical protein